MPTHLSPAELKAITVTLPLPPKELSPNARCHWAKKAKIAKAYKDLSALTTLKAMMDARAGVPRHAAATVDIAWYTRTAMGPDPDNALSSCKQIFDGMTRCGLFSDDRGLTHLPIRFTKDAKNPRVVLTITPTL